MTKPLPVYRVLVLCLLCLWGCQKDSAITPTPSPPPPVTTTKTRQVRLVVEAGYDLSSTKAYSPTDSIVMDQSGRSLQVAKGKESVLFFLDKTSGNILALARVDTSQQEVTINAATVAKGLLDLLPAYPALSPAQRTAFDQAVTTLPAYADFLATVKGLMLSKQPIYATSKTFANQVLALNHYLLKTYLGDPQASTGSGRRTTADEDDFTNWVTNNPAAELRNKVHSFTKASFRPLKTGQAVTFMLEPEPIISPLLLSVQALSSVPDNYYTLYLNQSDADVKAKNQVALGSKIVSSLLGHLVGYPSSANPSQNDCVAALTLTLSNEMATSLAAVAGNASPNEVIVSLLKSGTAALLKTGYTERSCQQTLFSQAVFLKQLTQKGNALLNIAEAGLLLYEFAEMVPYVRAIMNPFDRSEIMQLYYGKQLPATVKISKDGTLEASYQPEAKVFPSVALVPLSYYAAWEKAGFTIKWTAQPGHGTTNLFESQTGKDGKATVQWTLPKTPGTYTLTAEAKDKEGDVLEGSPLTFQAKVVDTDSTEIYRLAALGNWTVQGFDPNNPPGEVYKLTLQTNGTGVYTVSTGTQYSMRWSIKKAATGYTFYDYGFWHPGFDDLERDRLRSPLLGFKKYGTYNGAKYIAVKYTKL